MTKEQIKALQFSWSLISRMDTENLGYLFYWRLFETSPELCPAWGIPRGESCREITGRIGSVVKNAGNPAALRNSFVIFGEPSEYRILKEDQQRVIAKCLVWTIARVLGELWTMDLCEAWNSLVGMIFEKPKTRQPQHLHNPVTLFA